jgi:thiol-disulfide isomerase/thioredoxin
MKKTCILLIFNLLCFISFAQRTIISGKILNPKNDSVEFISLSLMEYADLPVAKLSKDNTFCFVFELKGAGCWRIIHGKESLNLFVMPKDSIFLTFDMKNMDSTFSASGIHAAHYNYVREKFLGIKEAKDKNPTHTPEECMNFEDSLMQIERKFLHEYMRKNPEVAPEFALFHELELRYSLLYARTFAPKDYEMKHKVKELEVPLSANYYDFIDTTTINEPKFWISWNYQRFELRVLQFTCKKIKNRASKEIKFGNTAEVYQLGKILLTDSTKWFILAKILGNGMRGTINPEFVDAYQDFQRNCPYPYPKQHLTQLWQNVQKLQKGKAAPNFVATDLNGKSVSLADFRGKVVYLDIWTTTCAPCIWYMKHENTKIAKENFKDKGVVFVNVCLDNSIESWKKGIERLELQDAGVHLFQKGSLESEIAKSYSVNGFPATFIIDKNGNIFSASPPASNNPTFLEELEKALQIK